MQITITEKGRLFGTNQATYNTRASEIWEKHGATPFAFAQLLNGMCNVSDNRGAYFDPKKSHKFAQDCIDNPLFWRAAMFLAHTTDESTDEEKLQVSLGAITAIIPTLLTHLPDASAGSELFVRMRDMRFFEDLEAFTAILAAIRKACWKNHFRYYAQLKNVKTPPQAFFLMAFADPNVWDLEWGYMAEMLSMDETEYAIYCPVLFAMLENPTQGSGARRTGDLTLNQLILLSKHYDRLSGAPIPNSIHSNDHELQSIKTSALRYMLARACNLMEDSDKKQLFIAFSHHLSQLSREGNNIKPYLTFAIRAFGIDFLEFTFDHEVGQYIFTESDTFTKNFAFLVKEYAERQLHSSSPSSSSTSSGPSAVRELNARAKNCLKDLAMQHALSDSETLLHTLALLDEGNGQALCQAFFANSGAWEKIISHKGKFSPTFIQILLNQLGGDTSSFWNRSPNIIKDFLLFLNKQDKMKGKILEKCLFNEIFWQAMVGVEFPAIFGNQRGSLFQAFGPFKVEDMGLLARLSKVESCITFLSQPGQLAAEINYLSIHRMAAPFTQWKTWLHELLLNNAMIRAQLLESANYRELAPMAKNAQATLCNGLLKSLEKEAIAFDVNIQHQEAQIFVAFDACLKHITDNKTELNATQTWAIFLLAAAVGYPSLLTNNPQCTAALKEHIPARLTTGNQDGCPTLKEQRQECRRHVEYYATSEKQKLELEQRQREASERAVQEKEQQRLASAKSIREKRITVAKLGEAPKALAEQYQEINAQIKALKMELKKTQRDYQSAQNAHQDARYELCDMEKQHKKAYQQTVADEAPSAPSTEASDVASAPGGSATEATSSGSAPSSAASAPPTNVSIFGGAPPSARGNEPAAPSVLPGTGMKPDAGGT